MTILIYFFLFSQYKRVENFMQIVSLETICMKYQVLFSWKNKNKNKNTLSAEFAYSELIDNTV